MHAAFCFYSVQRTNGRSSNGQEKGLGRDDFQPLNTGFRNLEPGIKRKKPQPQERVEREKGFKAKRNRESKREIRE